MSGTASKLLVFVVMKALALFWHAFAYLVGGVLFVLRGFDLTRRTKWSKKERIDGGDYPETNSVHLAFDGAGKALAISDQDYRVLVRRFTPNEGWGKAEFIDPNSAPDAAGRPTHTRKYNPCVIYSAEGNALATWEEEIAYSADTGYIVRTGINHYTESRGWGTAEWLNHTPGDNSPVKVAGDTHGNVMAVWYHTTPDRSTILAMQYTPEAGWRSAVPIASHERITHTLRIVGDKRGHYLVLWDGRENQKDSGNYFYVGRVPVYACVYSPENGWGHARRIAENVHRDKADRFEVAFDVAGNAILVWLHEEGDVPNERAYVWAVRYDAVTGWGEAGPIDPGAMSGADKESESKSPKIAIDHSGNAIVVWKQDKGGGRGGGQRGIWANRYTAGQGWGSATAISKSSRNYSGQQIVMTPNGRAVVMWSQMDGFAAAYHTAADGWSEPESIYPYVRGDYGHDARIATDARGNIVMAWLEEASLLAAFRAMHYTPDQGWGPPMLILRDFARFSASPTIWMDPQGIAHAVWSCRNADSSHTHFWTSRLDLRI